MALVVFDIDGTLLTGPGTERRFFLELLRRGRIGPRQVLGFLWVLVRSTPTFGRHVLKKNKGYLAWLREDDLVSLAAAWAPRALGAAWFGPCLERLHRHQEAGDTVVLLSGTPQFVAEAIGTVLGVERVIGSRCVVGQGRFHACVPTVHPFREEKRVIVAHLARELGVALSDVVAYADSGHDLPLLAAVGTAVAVRPDRALASRARAEGWELVGEAREGALGALRRIWRVPVRA